MAANAQGYAPMVGPDPFEQLKKLADLPYAGVILDKKAKLIDLV